MDLAVAQEGHPDNLGASLHGGVTVTCWDAETRAVVSLPVPEGIEFAVLVPDFEASTAAARAALPASYPRPDAVYNVVRVALLVAAWTQARWDLVGQAMSDRLHQPYRGRAMFPWLDGVLAAARGAGALGAALSGAGPSVLGLAPAGGGEAVAAAMTAALARTGHAGRGHVLARRRPGSAGRAASLRRVRVPAPPGPNRTQGAALFRVDAGGPPCYRPGNPATGLQACHLCLDPGSSHAAERAARIRFLVSSRSPRAAYPDPSREVRLRRDRPGRFSVPRTSKETHEP